MRQQPSTSAKVRPLHSPCSIPAATHIALSIFWDPRLHYRLLTLRPTDPVGQSWPRGTGSVGDSVGEGYYSVIHLAVLLQCETPSSADARSGMKCQEHQPPAGHATLLTNPKCGTPRAQRPGDEHAA